MHSFLFSLLFYDLNPPFILTNPGEVNTWSFIGSLVNMKKHFRLTSFGSSDYGGLCNRVPTTSVDWELAAEVGFNGCKKENTFRLFFSEEFCPNNELLWKGISFVIENKCHNSTARIVINENNGKTLKNSEEREIKVLNITKNSMHYIINIQKLGFLFKINVTTMNETFSYEYKSRNNINYGYFSVDSKVNGKIKDNILYYIKIIPKSKQDQEFDKKIDEKNRKIINSNTKKRIAIKNYRRGFMKMIKHYQDEVSFNNLELNNNGQVELKNSFKEINELINRAGDNLNVYELNSFINVVIKKRIEKSLERIELICQNLNELREELLEPWENTKKQLQEISFLIKNFMEITSHEINNNVQNEIKNFRRKNVTVINEIESEPFTEITFFFCFVEFIIYIIFIVRKHMKSKGWKKIE